MLKAAPFALFSIFVSVMAVAQNPSLFQPVSNALPNRDLTISPDGAMMLTTIQSYKREVSAIILYEKKNEKWGKPEIAPFSGTYSDLEPAFSPDGNKLFFASNRPTPEKPEKTDYDIWYVEKTDNGWSEPIHLPETINTDTNEFYPSVANDGSLYFTATYENSKGKEDIYVSKWQDGSYQKAESLSEGVNSATWEFNAYVAPDESYIIFSSFGRDDDLGGGDLYISHRNENGNWSPAKHFGEAINSQKLDYCPFVDYAGNLYFTSSKANFKDISIDELMKLPNQVENGLDNVYIIDFKKALSTAQ